MLWLAVRIVDHANRERPPGEIKVGGHQASSASMVGIMTALWFGHLGGADKVAVKPHASPVYHAIKYLTGELDARTSRACASSAGCSRTRRGRRTPTSSTSRPARSASVSSPRCSPPRRVATSMHMQRHPRRRAFIALVGDAELDEGNVWEAITDPSLQGLGNVMLVVDTNRQSLDRVIPDQKIKKVMEVFDGAGWHVVEAKYGVAAPRRVPPPRRRTRCASTSTPCRTRSTSRCSPTPATSCASASCATPATTCAGSSTASPPEQLAPLVQNLGGHDLGVLLDAYRACDADTERPSVVFAYTVKGWGLPIAGDPLNHAALLTGTQIDELRASLGLTHRRRSGTASTRRRRPGRVRRRLAAS